MCTCFVFSFFFSLLSFSQLVAVDGFGCNVSVTFTILYVWATLIGLFVPQEGPKIMLAKV